MTHESLSQSTQGPMPESSEHTREIMPTIIEEREPSCDDIQFYYNTISKLIKNYSYVQKHASKLKNLWGCDNCCVIQFKKNPRYTHATQDITLCEACMLKTNLPEKYTKTEATLNPETGLYF